MTHRSRTEGAECHCLKRQESKPKGLLRWSRKVTLSRSDKNEGRPLEMISQTGATPLNSLRIVKPRCRERNRRWRKSHLTKDLTAPGVKTPTESENDLGADRRKSSAGELRDTKSAVRTCTCENCQPFQESTSLRTREE